MRGYKFIFKMHIYIADAYLFVSLPFFIYLSIFGFAGDLTGLGG